MRILIVEDEVRIRTGISKLISAHTVHTVVGEGKNGQEGLEMIQRFHPDLVISDIRMPIMDGLTMVKEARDRGADCHFVILSGYSEFDYAQKAIRYGVEDYLLKPLAPEDVSNLLNKIEKEVEQEEKESAQTTEGLLRDIFQGRKENISEKYGRLKASGVFQTDQAIFVASGYVGDVDSKYCINLEKILKKMRSDYPGWKVTSVYLENTREMIALFQGNISPEEMEKKLNRRVYLNLSRDDMPVWTLGTASGIDAIRECADRLRTYYLYGIILGYRTILTDEKIRGIKNTEFLFPRQLQNNLQNAVCSGSSEQIQEAADAFRKHVNDMTCEPVYIQKSYKKILSFLENVCHETNPEAYRLLQKQDLERKVLDSFTLHELEQCFEKAIQIIMDSKNKKEDIRNYTIKKAITFIREHYMENISLDQLAGHLEITPEYLSTLFNKEVGINFSIFLKRFRISQAKRLLKGTDKKVYEIAAEVGYNDPKYFNRVFKEKIGISPGDYRQGN